MRTRRALTTVAVGALLLTAGAVGAGALMDLPQDATPATPDPIGDILRATSQATVRTQATTTGPSVGIIDAGECVRVTAAPTRKLTELTNASSGGWLEVQAVDCAAPAVAAPR